MSGVYVVWHGGNQPATVLVGRGVIRDEIAARRIDPDVQRFANLDLFVTWASVLPAEAAAVQSFLTNQLNPKIAQENFFGIAPVPVNLPW